MTLHVSQAHLLKRQPDTPLGRRDALLVCLFLDQGFRCGEVHTLRVKRIDLEAGTVAVSTMEVLDRDPMENVMFGSLSVTFGVSPKPVPVIVTVLVIPAFQTPGEAMTMGGTSWRSKVAQVLTLFFMQALTWVVWTAV